MKPAPGGLRRVAARGITASDAAAPLHLGVPAEMSPLMLWRHAGRSEACQMAVPSRGRMPIPRLF